LTLKTKPTTFGDAKFPHAHSTKVHYFLRYILNYACAEVKNFLV